MAWSMEEKTFCVTLYLETKSLKTILARYRKTFNFNDFPHKFQITHWVKKFKDTGTLIKSTKKGQLSTSGRKLTARSSESVDGVQDSVAPSPKKSLRRRSQECMFLSCHVRATASSKEFLDLQATTECGFTLKRVRDMIRTYIQMHRTDKFSQQLNHLASLAKWLSVRL